MLRAGNNRRGNRVPRAQGVLPFKKDFSPKSLDMVKHSVTRTVNEETEKTTIEVPKLRVEATNMEYLHFINSFEKARRVMSWTTGPRLFNKFQMHLEDDHETKWDDITTGLNETVANFDQAISEFTSQRFQPDDYHVHKKFLLSLRKPGEVDPEMFLSLLRYHNRLLALLPGAPIALEYYPGVENIEADTLSRYPRTDEIAQDPDAVDLAFHEAMLKTLGGSPSKKTD